MTPFITDFKPLNSRFRSAQSALLDWLAEAYAVHGAMSRSQMHALLARYGAAADAIAYRGYEVPDFGHRVRRRMRLFGSQGSDLADKMRFFDETVTRAFQRLYPARATAPAALVHVTCTGYTAPSPAQRLVSARGWGQRTQVLHAYHMGCYAAHPALRIAAGALALPAVRGSVDIVHTELCSLHLNSRRPDPEQLVIQSLFADGYMRYRLQASPPTRGASFEVLALQEEVLPKSTGAMTWTPGPFHFTMTLGKDVPQLLTHALPGFIRRLFAQAGVQASRARIAYAIHPGGPRILEWAQRALGLSDADLRWSRQVLREHGNMSSATLPHIWQAMLRDPRLPTGTLVVSVGAGPGLTLSGALLRKHSPTR